MPINPCQLVVSVGVFEKLEFFIKTGKGARALKTRVAAEVMGLRAST